MSDDTVIIMIMRHHFSSTMHMYYISLSWSLIPALVDAANKEATQPRVPSG